MAGYMRPSIKMLAIDCIYPNFDFNLTAVLKTDEYLVKSNIEQ